MRRLSISRAWDETRTILARDGQLYVSVALALVAFPALISGLINPKGTVDTSPAQLWVSVLTLVASLIVLAGQLALIRLALRPSITVGAAIAHGMRRLPIYFLAALVVVASLFLVAVPFAAALAALGVPVQAERIPATPPVVIALLLYLAIAVFVGVRMSVSAATASAEPIGPIAVLKRSWQLSAGHFWQLFGFLVMFFIGAMAVLIGIGSAVAVLVGLFIGPIEPMSVSALILALVHAVLNAVLTAVLAVMMARIYVQLAERGESESGVPISGT
jgi:hypothetical protein